MRVVQRISIFLMAEVKRLLPFLLMMFFAFGGSPEKVFSQQRYPKVDFYRSPFGHAIHLDPIGYALGRIGVKYEFRTDPLLSNSLEFVYQLDIKKKNWKFEIPSYSLGYGQRIYLRDNAAMEGIYFGVNGALAYASASIHLRVTPEIGYKIILGHTSHFFIEPTLLYDVYVIRPAGARPVLPYVALPFGYLW